MSTGADGREKLPKTYGAWPAPQWHRETQCQEKGSCAGGSIHSETSQARGEGSRSRNLEVPGQQKGKGEGHSLQEDREDCGLTGNKGAVPRPVSPQLLAGGKRGKNGDDGLPWWLSGGEFACVQETQVPSLVPEDPTCSRATSLCTSTTELVPRNHNHGAPAPHQEKSQQGKALTSQLGSSPRCCS